MEHRLGHYDWQNLRCGYGEDEACKMDRQNKKCCCARKGGRRKNNAGTDKKRKRIRLGHWLRRTCLFKVAVEGVVNGKTVHGKRRCQMIDNIMINGLYADTERKAEKRV